jgi:hypothetical protein
MEMKTKSGKFALVLKSCILIALAASTVNVYAMYLGNPDRPNTVWVPGHCASNGCWVEGHYLKFMHQPSCHDVAWVDGQYDRNGNWIPAHWQVRAYVIMNPGSDSEYPGFAM